ncbi:putative porin [Brenneria populi subsp. brevivirga]|uniref:putative porin n=1 Tax=Brenneria populi TaxID=1505588 RepID=UPI002E181573|nr:putative porin [Brenneria populi subsp. brevivirga]
MKKNLPGHLAAAIAAALALSSGQAQAAPSENATVNLINLLVQQGVLKREQAEALIAQAQAEARQAVEQRQTTESAAQPGDVRVPYVPETVRDQIRDEVKQEVIAQAKAENWAAPNAFPDWASRIKVTGDVRTRYESRFYSDANSTNLVDYQALNENGPYDVNTNTNKQLPPLLNSRQDRENRFRIRARFGIEAQLADEWISGVRVATGSDDSPVTTTQTLGNDDGKKNLWLDRAWIRWRSPQGYGMDFGRGANPFMTTDLLWSNDLNLDGISFSAGDIKLSEPLSLFGTLGAFPLDYGSDSWPADSQNKGKSEDKWLYGAQAGVAWQINERNRLRGALAYYYFDNIAGVRSEPCALYDGAPACSSDWSRPKFMQKGNTLFALRNIVQDPADPANTAEPQYFGLASEFNLLDVNLMWDTETFNAMKLRLQGNYVRNLAYDEGEMERRSQGQIAGGFVDGNGDIDSGPNAYMLQAVFGRALEMETRGDWNVFAGYKYIEPDAMPDAYNDSSFHLGGTNARGYFLGASYALDDRIALQGRWSSSKEVSGDPLSIDVFQLDLNARF